MGVHQNSIEAYKRILDSMPASRARVLRVIVKRKKGITRQDIAARLNLPINSVTPRVCELMDEGLIAEAGRERTDFSTSRALLEARPPKKRRCVPVPKQGRLSL